MTDRQIQSIIDYAEEKIAKGVTKEEAVLSLQGAGILDENGELTPPYKNLPLAFDIVRERDKHIDWSKRPIY